MVLPERQQVKSSREVEHRQTENKKNRNKIGAKMKTLEAKPFDQNAENWKRENRMFTLTVLEAGVTA